DLEKMDWQELETAALHEDIPVPEGLEKRISEKLTARAIVAEPAPKKTGHRILWTAVAAAAVLAAVLALPSVSAREPKDTFDDPQLAYAQVEEAFQLIGQNMAKIINNQ
ncbi:MAG: hypothetical protein II408_02150, partial [Bacteroidales bacterium]|nr:hypothetical protein [Bacteroidales bacterium]